MVGKEEQLKDKLNCSNWVVLSESPWGTDDRIIVLYGWASCLVVFASPSFIGVSWSCIEIVRVLLLQAIWCPEELAVLAFPMCTCF